jgi:hypothetical protein
MEFLRLIGFNQKGALGTAIYVSMYLCIYVSMYLCIYVSIYLSMYRLENSFFLKVPEFCLSLS